MINVSALALCSYAPSPTLPQVLLSSQMSPLQLEHPFQTSTFSLTQILFPFKSL